MLSISVSTVSRALSDHPDISEETKIASAKSPINSTICPIVRPLSKKNTRMIAPILPEFNRFFVPDLIRHPTLRRRTGLQSHYLSIRQNPVRSRSRNHQILPQLGGWRCSFRSATIPVDLNHLQILKDSQIPVVLLDKVLTSTWLSHRYHRWFCCSLYCYHDTDPEIKKEDFGCLGHEKTYPSPKILFWLPTSLIRRRTACRSGSPYLIVNHIQQINRLLEAKTRVSTWWHLFFMTDELLVHGQSFFEDGSQSSPGIRASLASAMVLRPTFLFPHQPHLSFRFSDR